MTPQDPFSAGQPLVSVITPVLNRASTIRTCLTSVASQSYPRIEHIVVDGGSTDGTIDVVKSFASGSSLRWISEKDDGMYDAVNKGLAMAQGDVLAYLNSDDLYLPWTVTTAVDELKNDVDLVYGDLGVLRMIDETRSRFFIQFYPPFNLRYYTHIAALGQPTIFWKRVVTDEIGKFDTSYGLIGDCEYWLRAATHGSHLAHVDEVLAVQIDHGETLRFTQPDRLNDEFQRLRTYYARVAPPLRYPKLHSYLRSLRWRLHQWRFLLMSGRRDPDSWPQFIAFLKRHDVRINRFGSLLYYTLPGKLRPSWAKWVDTSGIKEKILDEIDRRDAPEPPKELLFRRSIPPD